MGAIGAVVFFALVAGGVFAFKAQREAKAKALYEEAITLYPTATSTKAPSAQEYAAVAAKLEEVKNLYGSTVVGTNAFVDLGSVYFQTGDYDKAVSCYMDFLERADSRNALHAFVLESLGETYEAKGSYSEALEVYQQLASESAPIYQAQAQLYLGRVYEAIGDQEKATNHYESYLDTNPDTLFSESIRTKLMHWRQSGNSKEQEQKRGKN